jgi:hypothetical protein
MSATAAPAPPTDGRVPIVIGITGHRNIASDDPALRAAVRAEFERLARAYKNTPFLVLSGLAEGFDRLAAQVALDVLPECRLIAVLPMPRADYEADFATDASRAEFAALLGRAEGRIEISPPEDDESWKAQGSDARDALYARGGAATAEHAQILIALWDGEDARGEGGTGNIVKWFQRGLAPKRHSLYLGGELSPLDPPEPGLLIHIKPGGKVERTITRTRDGVPSAIKVILERTRCFNRDIARNARRMGRNWPLMPDVAGLDAAKLLASAPGVVAVYNAADTLAVRFRDMVRWYDRAFYMLLGLAILFYALRDLTALAVVFYLVMGGGALVIWLVFIGRGLSNRYLEDRALAEAMRVVFFWRLAGIAQPAWLSYLAKHSGAVTWVRHAVRTVELRHRATVGHSRDIPEEDGLRAARQGWLADQIGYFKGARKRHADYARRWKNISRAMLGVSTVLAVLLATAGAFYGNWQVLNDGWNLDALGWRDGAAVFGVPLESIAPLWQVALGVATAAGVIARAYLARAAHEDLVKQYDAALSMFESAAREYDQAQKRIDAGEAPDWPRAEVLTVLGREALVEHGEWVVLRHSRPHEVPRG